jgi:hypothetical protein
MVMKQNAQITTSMERFHTHLKAQYGVDMSGKATLVLTRYGSSVKNNRSRSCFATCNIKRFSDVYQGELDNVVVQQKNASQDSGASMETVYREEHEDDGLLESLLRVYHLMLLQ